MKYPTKCTCIVFKLFCFQFLGSAYWPTVPWQWVFSLGSILCQMGVPQMLGWIFLKVNDQILFNLTTNLSHVELLCCLFFSGRYSEGESRYNLSSNIIKAATMVSRCFSVLNFSYNVRGLLQEPTFSKPILKLKSIFMINCWSVTHIRNVV